MIDLSYLTEEEQEMIMVVLKRDAELKKAEEKRVKKLQKTERDRSKLKFLTGEWFYETKSHRHRDRIHGSDIIRASMRHRKPVTILELSEFWTKKSSFQNSERKDVFIPPELSGILDEFPSQDRSREDQYHLAATQQNTPTSSAQPQNKPRQNPFNTKPVGVESPNKTDGHLTSGAVETRLAPAKVQQTPAEPRQPDAKAPAKPCLPPVQSTQTPAEEFPPPNESPIPSNSNPNTESPKTSSLTTRPHTKKKLLFCSSHDSVLDTSGDPVTTQNLSPTPRGILKQSSSSCSFTDSISLQNSFGSQPTSPLSPESSESSNSPPLSPSPEWASPGALDRKQVRFSPIIQARDTGSLEVPASREHVEHGLLDWDCTPPFDQEGEPDTIECRNTKDPLICQYTYREKGIGDSDSEPLISAQSAAIANATESPPAEPAILSSGKVGEFLGCGNWSDETASMTSAIQNPLDHHEDHAEPRSTQVSEPPTLLVEQGGSVEPSPVRTALKPTNVRPISISKSLENLASLPSREERRKNEQRSDITVSVEDVSAAPLAPTSSLSDPEQMKMLSVSVPAFIQQQRKGRGSDCTSVNSFHSERQRKGSTNTNISASSDLASMYSVSGSVTSIYGTDFGNVEVKGTIQFAINYVQKLGEFHIFIAQCRDLAVAEPKRNRSDPYVKCYLLPDKAKLGKRKTAVKKKTLNPTYNEILRYKIPLENLKAHTLNLSVWHNDTFGRNSFLGEVDVDLSEWDFNSTHMMDYALKGRVQVPVQYSPKRVNHCIEMSGEMRVALRFLQQTSQSKKTPQTGEVQIWVKECKDLSARGGTLDPFVKCNVLPDTARKGRQKTRVVKRTANPVFNHTMVYDGFRPEDLREACVELTVWGHDRLSNHFIGGIRLGLGTGKSYGTEVDWMDSSSAEIGLWKRMIESQNEWVEDVVPLRMLVMARTMSK